MSANHFSPPRILPLVAWIVLLVPRLAAQDLGNGTLAGRMQGLVDAAPEAPDDSVAAFFPRRGDWTWVQTSHRHDHRGPARIGVWRFSGAETPRAVGRGGPLCHSFDAAGGIGPYEGRFGMQTLLHRGPWRRVRGTRFVPAGESADSPVFVEWRREDGRWVVAALGDLDVHFPRVLGRPASGIWRDTLGVPEDAAFAPADWYTITVNGSRWPKYGNPRPVDRALLARIGVLQGVSVFADRERDPEGRSFVYLPTSPGHFQSYQAPHGPYVCS